MLFAWKIVLIDKSNPATSFPPDCVVRVLRPGGLIWLEKLYEKNEDMPKFMQKVELLGYKRHSWVEWKRNKDSRKFSAVLEKLYPPQEGSKR